MDSFDGKVAAVTGAGSGIGRALALRLADEGCAVALADIDAANLTDTAAMIADAVAVTTAKVDVADREAVHRWADEVVLDHGRVNLVFNNAGVAHHGNVEDTTYDDLEWIVGTNLWGVIHGTKAFLPHLRASGDGHVVNVSSIFGLFSQPGMSAYNATKFAVRGFTEALRQELELERAPVSATCVHPGGVRTNIATHSRLAGPTFLGDAEESRARFERLFVTPPAAAAKVILDAVRRNRRRVLVGADAHAVDLLQRLAPQGYQHLVLGAARLAARLVR